MDGDGGADAGAPEAAPEEEDQGEALSQDDLDALFGVEPGSEDTAAAASDVVNEDAGPETEPGKEDEPASQAEPATPPPAEEARPQPEPIPASLATGLDDADREDDDDEDLMDRRRTGKIVAFIAAVLVAVAISGLFIARDAILAFESQWPEVVRIYRLATFSPEPLGAGLSIRGVKSDRGEEEGVKILEVRGLLLNTDKKARAVPLIHVALYDANEEEVQSRVIEPVKKTLMPGESIDFRVVLKTPHPTARKLEVTFAKR